MKILGCKAMALFLAAAPCSAALAQDAEEAYRIRASIYADRKLVTAASWVGVIDRTSTVRQTFSTPYRRDIALNESGTSVEGLLEGQIAITVRPFAHGGALCLNVKIDSHTVSQLHHYRSDALLEVLPGGGGYSAGGDYCDFERTADGLLFSLAHGDEANYGEILVAPEKPVQGAG